MKGAARHGHPGLATPMPPDDAHEWLPLSEVAQLLGLTRQAVNARLARGQVPFEVSGGCGVTCSRA